MNWRNYFNTSTMTKARMQICNMSLFKATKFIRENYKISLSDSIDFAKAFSND